MFNNTLTSTATDQALTAAQGKVLSDSKLDKTSIVASGTAPLYACRAWVNFNGTGTVTIRASGNVSSITDNGVGDYTINFTTAMPDANYAVAFSTELGTGEWNVAPTLCADAPPLTTAVRIRLRADSSSTNFDRTYITAQIIR